VRTLTLRVIGSFDSRVFDSQATENRGPGTHGLERASSGYPFTLFVTLGEQARTVVMGS